MGAISWAVSLRTRQGISSGPEAFDGLTFSIRDSGTVLGMRLYPVQLWTRKDVIVIGLWHWWLPWIRWHLLYSRRLQNWNGPRKDWPTTLNFYHFRHTYRHWRIWTAAAHFLNYYYQKRHRLCNLNGLAFGTTKQRLRDFSLPGIFAPRSESSRELSFQGANVPGNIRPVER